MMPVSRALQRMLAGPSRAASGISPKDAEQIILSACGEAVRGTVKGAIAGLEEASSSPPVRIKIAEHAPIVIPTAHLKIGRTTYLRDFPEAWRSHTTTELATDRLRAPLARTTVEARSMVTAAFLARERFTESAAILDLVVANSSSVDEVLLYRVTDGGGVTYSRPYWIVQDVVVDRGHLVPPYRQLARAAEKPEDRRTEWSRRLLAATRWHSQARRDTWTPDRLGAAMSMLECLFVDHKENPKGAAIADRLTERLLLNHMTPDEQIAWLVRLYRHRNDAVHDGLDFPNDLEVDLLLDLSRSALRRFCWLLVPGGKGGRRACRTFAEAMARTAP
jgi:hypothetical protein